LPQQLDPVLSFFQLFLIDLVILVIVGSFDRCQLAKKWISRRAITEA